MAIQTIAGAVSIDEPVENATIGTILATATTSFTIAGEQGPVDEDHVLSGNVLGDDAGSLTVTSVGDFSSTLGAIVTLSADGHFSYDPRVALNRLAVGEPALDSFSFTTSDAGSHNVAVRVTGLNDPTTIAEDAAAVTVDEGSPAANTGTFFDADFSDGVVLTASAGTVTKLGISSGSWNWSFNASDGPAQGQTITITANDGHGSTASTSFTLVVNNLAPTATPAADQSIHEGETVIASLTSPHDASSVDTTAGFRYSFALSSGGLATSYAAAQLASSAPFTFPDNGSYTIHSRIFDKDGGFTDYQTAVAVANVAPSQLTAGVSPAIINENGTTTVNGSFVDPGTLDTHTVVINWGPGEAPTTLTLAAWIADLQRQPSIQGRQSDSHGFRYLLDRR